MPTTTGQKRLLNIKQNFPVLTREFDGRPIHYLDNAATTQKPDEVIRAMDDFYRESYGTVRRGVYRLSEKATAAFEGTRVKAAKLLGAGSHKEIVYTSGSTQSINLVAYSYGRKFVQKGDEILLSQLEHHANIVPWQMVAEEKEAVIKVIPCNDAGELDIEAYAGLLSPRTRVVAVNHVSNALGTINPVARMISMAHEAGAVVLVDGAQSAPHMKVDVQALDADFYVFSGHKIFGPTGVGILYGKMELLEKMPPFQRGGDMIEVVTFEKTTFQKPPHRFEAGTPPIVEVVGLGAALDYVQDIGLDRIAAHEQALLEYALKKMQAIQGLRVIGQPSERSSIISFVLDAAHPHDIGTLLDGENISIRAGHHCAQPVMQRFGIPATARASFGPYNDFDDVDALVRGIYKILEVFS